MLIHKSHHREELAQPVFTAMDAFEFAELHDESIPSSNFLRHLSKLMAACGVKDFSWRDVWKPEPPRLRRNLSAIINFCKFRDEKLYAFDDLNLRMTALAQEAANVEAERAKNAAELRRLHSERAQQLSDVSKVEAEDQSVLLRNNKLNKQQAALQEEVRGLKQVVNQASDAASQAKFDLTALEQDHDQLLDQVVHSPEKHKQAISELASAAEDRRVYYAQLGNTSIDNDRKLELINKFEKEVGRCIKLMEDLDAAVGRKKDVSQQVKDSRQAISSNERLLAETSGTTATLRRHIDTVSDKLQRLEHQGSLKLEAAASCVEEQLKSREAVEAENAAMAARAAEDEAAIRTLKEKMLELQMTHDGAVRGVFDKYAVLRQSVKVYNSRIMDASDCRGEAMVCV
jgi:kinetochore protein Nuf2